MDLPKIGSSSSKRAQKASAEAQSGTQEVGPDGALARSDDQVELTKRTRVQPEHGIEYRVGEEYSRTVAVSFDPKAVAYFHTAGLRVELEDAKIWTSDGRGLPLDARVSGNGTPAENFAVSVGQKLSAEAEPWQFRVPGMPTGIFGKPHGVHVYGGEGGFGLKLLDAQGQSVKRENAATELDDFQGMRVETQVFRRNRRTTLGQLASAAPPVSTGPAELPFTDTSIPNVSFRAPTKDSLETATASFDKILGRVAAERVRTVDLEQLKIFEAQYQAKIAKELESGGEVDGFAVMQETMDEPKARQAMQEIYGFGAGALSNGELLAAVGEKLLRASPIEIVVMPSDKGALDCLEPERESTRQQLSRAGRAYFLRANPFAYRAETGSDELPTQRLFIGEEILATELGVKAVFTHELLHVFEHLYANSEETHEIQTSFQEAQEFQSLYGSSRDEYITTVGEEFFSTHGEDGPAWVKKHHPRLYALLTKLTSTEPLLK